MKILYITSATFSVPHLREDMLIELSNQSDEVVVLGNEPEIKWRAYFKEIGVRYREYPVSRNGLSPYEDIQTYRTIKRIIKEEIPDKIITNLVKANIYGCLAAHEAGIEDVYVIMGGLGSVFHGTDLKSRLARVVVKAEYKKALQYAKKIFFQNNEDSNLLISLGLVNPNQVVRINGSGVNITQFSQQPFPKKTSFLFIGRLVKGKGVMEYLEAARIVKKLYPDVIFSLVGPYDTNPSALKVRDIEPYVESGIAIYYGEQKDVRPFLATASCFVLPSYYGEGTPKSGLEALATGRPVIVADAVGCREIVENGVNGYLVKPQSSASLAEAMLKIVRNPEVAQRMGNRSRTLAEQKYDVRLINRVITDTIGL